MEKQCSLLQELRLSECVLQNCIKVEGQIAVQLPTPSPRKEFTPLSALGDWYDYFKYLNGFEAMGYINPDFTPAEMQLPTSASICQLVKLIADSSSMVLTALAALELADPDLSSRTRLTIHVVGATAHELMILRLNEEFLHPSSKPPDAYCRLHRSECTCYRRFVQPATEQPMLLGVYIGWSQATGLPEKAALPSVRQNQLVPRTSAGPDHGVSFWTF
ncbi:MAG: hypothetical protein Q9226_008077 [Calogaya cf. arnoldii]